MDALSSLGINGPFLLAQIFNFFVLFILLRRFLFKPMTNMLESRKQRIADGLQAAELARREAEAERAQLQTQIDTERREAMERVAAASKRGETLAAEIEGSARQDAQKILEDARNEAVRERERIIAEAQDQIAELAMLAAEKVLGRELSNRDAQRAFVNEFLAANGKARN
ncbi:MAG TPA: F0F1 ATP synthase subunit B [Anaerolineae bacterium]|nr:F0F1 ATP synthase subunit B [Anaerolineae bacterium]HNU04950.1 F0F1 ATP synthase subunit B [Anaerolineae bacterium]